MAVIQKGAISFGLVYIPVSLYTATQDSDISFNQLHKADKSRIRYKKVCAHCGKEVEAKDIVRGFQYAKDEYVIITDEEIESIKTEKDRTITIMSFTALEEISPVYYDKAYHAVPQKGGGKALELLRRAMLKAQRAALGKAVLGNSEKLLLLIPREDGMLIQTLLFQDDIKEIPVDYERPNVTEAELEMAGKLIEGMEEPFAPEKYKDEFQEKLKAMIAEKIAGKAVTKPKEEKPGVIIDLMEALKASVKSAGDRKASATKARSRSVKTRKQA
ncbi:MAG: Ku protein [Clostridia bacterium]|nr:Ku protein [Clostridia bacterium]